MNHLQINRHLCALALPLSLCGYVSTSFTQQPRINEFLAENSQNQRFSLNESTCSEICSGLVAYWPLDSISGETTPDVVGGYNMELTNMDDSNVVEGKVGNAFSFSNGDQTLLSRTHEEGDDLPINKHESFTVSFWAKVQGNGQNDLRVFSESNTGGNNAPLFNLGTKNNGSDGTVDVYIRGIGATVGHIFTEAEPFDDKWSHVVFVQKDLERKIYVDGELDSLEIAPRAKGDWDLNATSIGGIIRASASHWVTGLIDDVALWKRALSESEVSDLNANGIPQQADKLNTEKTDWIEIYNPAAKAVSLDGWALTDDPNSRSKWIFPNVVLAPRQYLVVFASGKNITTGNVLHTNFKLDRDGEYLALIQPGGATVVNEFSPKYPRQRKNISFGLGARDKLQFFDKPTPGKTNGLGFAGFVKDTKFDIDRGFYNAPFRVNITCATSDAIIRYTIDGSKPSSNHGIIYQGPIQVSTTTTLRAAAFHSELKSSNVDTHTYLFVEDIIRQPAKPPGFPTEWNGHTADYEMDPEVVNDSTYKGRISAALKSIPSLSLVLNQDDFFKTGQGIYPKGQGVEKATSAELIYPNKNESAQVDGSVQIVGGSSTGRWKSEKLSMRLKFTSQFGDASFNHPVFGKDAARKFDTLVVDAQLNNVWSYGGGSSPSDQRRKGQNTRDQFVADLQNQTGGYAPHGIHVHVYINGLYWGLHTLHERPDEHFAAHYLGGSKEDYDVMKHRNSTVVNGNSSSYKALISATSKNLSSRSAYKAVQQQLDMTNFIDYMLVNFYVGNHDWSHQNWYASSNRTISEGRWRFHSWDAEHVLKGVNDNSVTKNNATSPTGFHQSLKRNIEYKRLFGDRVHQHFFNGGALTPEKTSASYRARLDSIDEAIVAESARWGDNQRSTPYTRDKEWVAEKNRLLQQYFPKRTGIVLSQLRSQKLYPSIDAPILSQHGGSIPIGFKLKLKASKGVTYFTLDGSDPRLPGGTLSGTANKYSNAFPLEMTTLVKSRVKYQNEWSALVEAKFIVGKSLEKLMITEVMYHPLRGRSEFLELKNTGAEPLSLGGVKISGGIRFTFPEGSELAPGAFVVLAEKAEDFNRQYPGLTLGGVYDGRLSNGSEKIELIDSFGKPFLSLTYSDQPPWPSSADGSGLSLVPLLANTNPNPNAPNNWRACTIIGGSPGRDDYDPYNIWLQKHFTTEELSQMLVSGADADPDNDNMNNLAEYTAGTIPKDINSRLEIRMIQFDETEKQLLVQFLATPHRSYQLLQSSKALGPWKPIGAPYSAQDGGVAEFTVPLRHVLDQAVFFRLKIP